MNRKIMSAICIIVLCAAMFVNTGCAGNFSKQGMAAKKYIREKYGISIEIKDVNVKKAWCLLRGSYYAGLTEVRAKCGDKEFVVYYDEDDKKVKYDDYQTPYIREAIISHLSDELIGTEDIIVDSRMPADLVYDGEDIEGYLKKAADHKGDGYINVFVAFVDKDLSDVRSFSKAGGWIDEGLMDMNLFSFVSKEDMDKFWNVDGLSDLINNVDDPLRMRERRFIEHGKERNADFYEKREIQQYGNLMYSVPDGLEVTVYTIDEYTVECENSDNSVELNSAEIDRALDEGYIFVNKNGGSGKVICMYPLDKVRYFEDAEKLEMESVKGYFVGEFSFYSDDRSNWRFFCVDSYKYQ